MMGVSREHARQAGGRREPKIKVALGWVNAAGSACVRGGRKHEQTVCANGRDKVHVVSRM